MNIAEVNQFRCREIAKVVKNIGVTKEHGDPIPEGLDPTTAENFYFALIAICHQTTPLSGSALQGYSNGRFLRGWDYLKDRFLQAAIKDPAIVDLRRLAWMNIQDFQTILDDGRGGGIIYRPQQRVELLKDIGQVTIKNGWKNAHEIFEASGGHLEGGDGRGLINILREFRAYQDPLNKKTYVLLAMLKNNGLWTYADPEKLGPPVDYHVTRGFLRTGCVDIKNKNVKEALAAQKPVTLKVDLAIRGAVLDAVELVSREAGLKPEDAHHFFWNVFRACCNRETPHCNGCPPICTLPGRYRHDNQACVFSEACGTRTRLWEHNFVTDWY